MNGSWQRFNIIASDDSDGSNAIEEVKNAIEVMPKEFQEYVKVVSHVGRNSQIGTSTRYPARMALPFGEDELDSVKNTLNNIKKTGNRINILYPSLSPYIVALPTPCKPPPSCTPPARSR